MTTDWDMIKSGQDLIRAGGGRAVMVWVAGDVSEGRSEVSEEKALEWLESIERPLKDRMAEVGNEMIYDLCPYPEDDDES